MGNLRFYYIVIPNNQIKALLTLIEDPDEDIFLQVKK